MAGCGKGRSDSHACENLHNLLHKSGHMLRVKFTFVSTPVRLAVRGTSKKAMVRFPLLTLTNWCHNIFGSGGHFLLGGLSLDAASVFGDTLQLFWSRYKMVEPNLPFFQEPGHDLSYCIPYALHGDEGRGAGRTPVMVVSAQPLIVAPDMSVSNLKGLLVPCRYICCFFWFILSIVLCALSCSYMMKAYFHESSFVDGDSQRDVRAAFHSSNDAGGNR